jgi:hypothetical protein
MHAFASKPPPTSAPEPLQLDMVHVSLTLVPPTHQMTACRQTQGTSQFEMHHLLATFPETMCLESTLPMPTITIQTLNPLRMLSSSPLAAPPPQPATQDVHRMLGPDDEPWLPDDIVKILLIFMHKFISNIYELSIWNFFAKIV